MQSHNSGWALNKLHKQETNKTKLFLSCHAISHSLLLDKYNVDVGYLEYVWALSTSLLIICMSNVVRKTDHDASSNGKSNILRIPKRTLTSSKYTVQAIVGYGHRIVDFGRSIEHLSFFFMAIEIAKVKWNGNGEKKQVKWKRNESTASWCALTFYAL